MINHSRTGSRAGVALLGFLAIGATLHCGTTQEGEVGVDNLAGTDGGGTSLAASCQSGSANQTGCACAQGATIACYTGAAATRGVGTCKDGAQTCTAGALTVRSLHLDGLQPDALTDGYGYGPCTGEVLPTATATCGGTPSGGDSGGGGTTTPPASCPGALTQWTPMSMTGAPTNGAGAPLVWTGAEVVVFSGAGANNETVDGGRLYDPSSDSWRAMSATGQPRSRSYADAVWTGSRYIVWGGQHVTNSGGNVTNLDDGGIYDPTTDTWEAIPSPSSQGLTQGPTAGRRTIGWTGTELAIFGGVMGQRDGWFYDPTTKAWRAFGGGFGVQSPAINDNPSIDLWTGSAAVEYGSTLGSSTTMILGVFTDAAAMWKQGATSPLSTREDADFVQAGAQIYVHGGRALVPPYGYIDDGAMYDPVADSWTMLPAGGESRAVGLTAWTGCDVLELGGINDGGDDATVSGTRYAVATQTWSQLPTVPERYLGYNGGGVWAGDQLVIFAQGGNAVGQVIGYRLVP